MIRTDYLNLDNLWEATENVIPIEKTTEAQEKDKIQHILDFRKKITAKHDH